MIRALVEASLGDTAVELFLHACGRGLYAHVWPGYKVSDEAAGYVHSGGSGGGGGGGGGVFKPSRSLDALAVDAATAADPATVAFSEDDLLEHRSGDGDGSGGGVSGVDGADGDGGSCARRRADGPFAAWTSGRHSGGGGSSGGGGAGGVAMAAADQAAAAMGQGSFGPLRFGRVAADRETGGGNAQNPYALPADVKVHGWFSLLCWLLLSPFSFFCSP